MRMHQLGPLRIPHVPVDAAFLVLTFLLWVIISFINPTNPPPIFGQAFLAMLGVFVTNRAYIQRRTDERLGEKVDRLEEVAAEAHPDVAHKKGIDGHA